MQAIMAGQCPEGLLLPLASNGGSWINPNGNDTLGKGGSGGSSPGLITSYKTQGTTALEAMQAASYFHARAAEQLGEQQSHASVMPMDIVHYLAK